MHRRAVPNIPAILAIALAACTAPAKEAAPAAPPAITQASVEQSVQEAVAALVAGDAAKAAAGFTSDGVFISARGKVDGQAAIATFWTGALKPGVGKNLKLEIVKWGTSGDMAYSLSRFTGGITTPSGHVLAVVQRQADGTLKTVAQISIPDPAK